MTKEEVKTVLRKAFTDECPEGVPIDSFNKAYNAASIYIDIDHMTVAEVVEWACSDKVISKAGFQARK